MKLVAEILVEMAQQKIKEVMLLKEQIYSSEATEKIIIDRMKEEMHCKSKLVIILMEASQKAINAEGEKV